MEGAVDPQAYKHLLPSLKVEGPTVLEIGYGLGIVHEYLHFKPFDYVWVLEIDPEVLAHKLCMCPSTTGDWAKTITGKYNDIVYDVEIDPSPSVVDRLKTHLLPAGRLHIHTVKGQERFEVV